MNVVCRYNAWPKIYTEAVQNIQEAKSLRRSVKFKTLSTTPSAWWCFFKLNFSPAPTRLQWRLYAFPILGTSSSWPTVEHGHSGNSWRHLIEAPIWFWSQENQKNCTVLFRLIISPGYFVICILSFRFFFQAEDGIRDRSPSRGLGDVYKRQSQFWEQVLHGRLLNTVIQEILGAIW